jgi:hypothetical protein
MELTREQVLRFRVHAQGLDAEPGSRPATAVPILDLGVQDTGPDGAGWALAARGARPGLDGLCLLWSLRGAPHAYRRSEVGTVVRRLVPLSQADAASRIFDASKPLAAAGVRAGEALARVAVEMRKLVERPTVKGDLSTAVTGVLPEPFLRWCNPCRATHPYEQTFRLGAMFGGLELEPGTSPPVLSRIGSWTFPARALAGLPDTAPTSGAVAGDELLLNVVGMLGPVGTTDLATFLDAPVKDVRARVAAMRDDGRLVDVRVEGSPVVARPDDIASLGRDPERVDGVVRLLGPYDLYLQGRDRTLLLPDKARHRELWPVLGRPGAVLAGAEIVGTWRPRSAGKRLRLLVEPWSAWPATLERAVDAQAELLGAFRGVEYAGRA